MPSKRAKWRAALFGITRALMVASLATGHGFAWA
jgi:hypothetical protein